MAIWLTIVSILAMGLLAVRVLGAGELPEPLARHVGGIYERSGELLWILALASVIMAMGLVDDLKNLDWRLRLGIQFALCDCARGVGSSGHAVRAVHASFAGGGGDGLLDRGFDQRV